MPAVNVKQFCCDDYCPKTPPCIFCPPRTDLKCPPMPPHSGQGTCNEPALPIPVAEQERPGRAMRARPALRPLDQ